MMKTGFFLSLLFFTALFFLPPVYLQAGTTRAPETLLPKVNPAGVNNAPAAQEDIRDIYGPVLLPDPPPYSLFAALALVMLVAILCFFWLRKRRKNAAPAMPDPADQALSALLAAETKLPETGVAIFADTVSHILRFYIEKTFKIGTTRQTTSEFFTQIRQTLPNTDSLLKNQADSLNQTLSLCDMVKFAGFLPENDTVRSLGQNVRSFIETTRRIPGTGV